MSATRVAVIGGGLAGLAAAARLRQLGAEPVVFERAAEVGGVVRTVHRDGWIIDTGPAMSAEPAPIVRELLDAAGLAGCTVRAGPAGATRYIVRDGAPVVLPKTTSELSSSSLLTLGGRLRLLKERLIPARRDLVDETVDSFARRRFGDEMADRMFEPLIASTCAGDARQIVARYAFPELVGYERNSRSALEANARARMAARRQAGGRQAGSWSCAEGMQQLPQRLAEWTGGVRRGTVVRRVAASSSGVTLTPGTSASERFDAAIFAVPAAAFGRLALALPLAERLSRIASVPHVSVVAVSLGFRRDRVEHALDGSRLLVPAIEGSSILSMVFPSVLFPGRAPDAHVLMTAFLGGALRADLLEQTDAELAALARSEAADLLGITGSPVIHHVTRWRDCLPQAVAGHGECVDAADAIEATEPRVAFTGSWRDGLAVGEVLLGGLQAADRLMARQRPGPAGAVATDVSGRM